LNNCLCSTGSKIRVIAYVYPANSYLSLQVIQAAGKLPTENYSQAVWPGGIGLANLKVVGSRLSGNNLGQVVHIHVPLSPSSIIWYWSSSGDAPQLGK